MLSSLKTELDFSRREVYTLGGGGGKAALKNCLNYNLLL